MRERGASRRRTARKKEFSKVAIGYLTGLWIAVGVAGLVIAVFNFTLYGCADFEALYTYVGAPMSCGLVGYFVKAAIENREKIRGANGEDNSTIADMSPHQSTSPTASPEGEADSKVNRKGSQRAE